MDLHRRAPVVSLTLAAVAVAVTVPLVLSVGTPAVELPWVTGTVIFTACAALVWRRRRHHPVAWWFAVSAGLVAATQTLDGVVGRLGRQPDAEMLAWVLLAYHVLVTVTVAAIAHLLGLFPDGRIQRDYERRILRALWYLPALVPVVFVAHPTLLVPSYHRLTDVVNPYAVPAMAPLGVVAAVALSLAQAVFVVGVVLLVLRYRRAGEGVRRQIRWLLVPALLAAFVAVLDVIAWRIWPQGATGIAAVLQGFLWIPVIASLPVALAVALLRPTLLDVDRVIRKSLVYAVLWTLIAAVYVGAAASLGLAAGRRLPVELAIALAVAATLVFQPARRRLERLADRWVFGARTEATQLITELGEALSETVELERLLPRMADTLQEGLGLRWARVRLEPAPPVGDDDPALVVPIVLDGERLGVVECGPKTSGALTEDDEAVVVTLARQAALAVRNVRLTAELERSRMRLVRAQEGERRRIERNIHDGVQQDLVALIGSAAHARSELRRDPAAGETALVDLQQGLQRVIGELRELAHGIHPSVLSDRGLLEAVEALAGRNTVPVSVRADPSLRSQRFAEEIEGAGYFTVAEALANVGKHAGATRAEVSLDQSGDSLRIEVRDDGAGFDAPAPAGAGLVNLAERLAALGGRLDIASRPGQGTTVTAHLRVRGA